MPSITILGAAFASCRKVVVWAGTEPSWAVSAESSTSEEDTDVYRADLPLAIEDGDDAKPLEHLTLAVNWDWDDLGAFLQRPEISRLIKRVREMEIYGDALAAVHLCSSTLTHLKIGQLSQVDFPEFPRLGVLRVLTLSTKTNIWPMDLDFFRKSLPTSLPLLEVLSLNLHAWGDVKGLDQAHKKCWPAVDDTLTALACLREMNFTVVDNFLDFPDYQESVERALPGVHRAGLLTFSFSREEETSFWHIL
ncbi:hypothetical protein C8R44DRAFT_883099 [Mycena epipterygia]|nr:hypothetical protein C8R44DRAFT_883099 [Mycena epipterygia]